MDKVFKIGLLVLGFGYLTYLFCPVTNQLGRYQAHAISSSQVMVIDTTNSDLYINKGSVKKWSKVNPKQIATNITDESLSIKKNEAKKLAEQIEEQKRKLAEQREEYKKKYETADKEIEEYKKRRLEKIRELPDNWRPHK